MTVLDERPVAAEECEACGDGPSGALYGEGVALCGSCACRVEDDEDLRRRIEFVDWLTPIQRSDWLACEVAGQTRADRARSPERDVEPPVVVETVSRAERRLDAIAEQEGGVEA